MKFWCGPYYSKCSRGSKVSLVCRNETFGWVFFASPRMTNCVVTFRQHAATSPVVVRSAVHERHGLLPHLDKSSAKLHRWRRQSDRPIPCIPQVTQERRRRQHEIAVQSKSLLSSCAEVEVVGGPLPLYDLRLQEACVTSAPGTHSRQQLSKDKVIATRYIRQTCRATLHFCAYYFQT